MSKKLRRTDWDDRVWNKRPQPKRGKTNLSRFIDDELEEAANGSERYTNLPGRDRNNRQ